MNWALSHTCRPLARFLLQDLPAPRRQVRGPVAELLAVVTEFGSEFTPE
jgi:hypothetical protein